MPKIVLSHTRVGFVLGSGYKYQTPTIVEKQPINQIQVNYFFFGSGHLLGVGVE